MTSICRLWRMSLILAFGGCGRVAALHVELHKPKTKDPGRQGIYETAPDAQHPFAIALKEYMASYDGVVHAGFGANND